MAITLLASGYAGTQPGISQAGQGNGQRGADAELQDVRTEAATLRADLAAARIAAAKQEAELRELRRQVNERQQLIDARQVELITLREERDRLVKSATIAQVRVADPSGLPASTADVHALRAKLHEMESALATLTTELEHVKKEMARPPQPFLLPPGEKARMKGEDKK